MLRLGMVATPQQRLEPVFEALEKTQSLKRKDWSTVRRSLAPFLPAFGAASLALSVLAGAAYLVDRQRKR